MPEHPRIALVGNMKNNNFALMRYFRDVGEDALFLLRAKGRRRQTPQGCVKMPLWNAA